MVEFEFEFESSPENKTQYKSPGTKVDTKMLYGVFILKQQVLRPSLM